MADLRQRIELRKLAAVLHVDESELAYLGASDVEELRALRRLTTEALFQRHEPRLKLLASASGILPAAVSAKIAEHALGATLSARVAGVMEPDTAAKLAGGLSPAFRAELASDLEPARVAPIMALLPREMVLDVARRLIAARDMVTLARLVTVVDAEVAVALADEIDPAELLQLVLNVEDEAGLVPLLAKLPAEKRAALLDAASDEEERAVALDLLSGPR